MALDWRSGRLQSGKLRHRIDIVKVSPTQDASGGLNWSVGKIYANVWASIEATGGDESAAAKSEVSVVTHQVLIRYIGAAPSWQPDTDYLAGRLVKDSGGYLQQAMHDGHSGSTRPVWNEVEGQQTPDGDPSTGETWLNLGLAFPYTGVTAALQVWFQGRQFQIKSVLNPDERNKMLCLMCVEINDSRQQLQNNQPGGLG